MHHFQNCSDFIRPHRNQIRNALVHYHAVMLPSASIFISHLMEELKIDRKTVYIYNKIKDLSCDPT
jgi:hypothetical protein